MFLFLIFFLQGIIKCTKAWPLVMKFSSIYIFNSNPWDWGVVLLTMITYCFVKNYSYVCCSHFTYFYFILHTWNPSTIDNCFQMSGVKVVVIEYGFGCWVNSFNCLGMFLPPFSGNNDVILISNVIKCALVSHCVSHIVSQSPCSFQTFIQQVWSLAQFY